MGKQGHDTGSAGGGAPRAVAFAGIAMCGAVLVALCGCGEQPSQAGAPVTMETACQPGTTAGCTCPDQTLSTLTCNPGGVWGSCDCGLSGPVAGMAGGPVQSAPPPGLQPPADPAGDSPAGPDETMMPVPAETGDPFCDVQQVLANGCQDCHGSDLKFGAPMPLLTWEDLHAESVLNPGKQVYELIPERVRSDTAPMPPAPNPRLDTAALEAIDTWLAAGRPRATGTCRVSTTGPDDGSDGDKMPMDGPADCEDFYELRAHGAPTSGDTSPFAVPSALDANSGNLYQCFYFDLPYEGSPQGLWFAPIIDDDRVLHHWILYGNDGAAGPAGADGSMRGCNANQPGSYFISGWAPGATATQLPDEVGLELPSGPNARFVLEVHYFNGNRLDDARDRSGVRFCTASQNRRTNTAGVHTTGTEGICLPPGQERTVTGVCDPRDDLGDIHVVSVWPHMHTYAIGQRLEVLRAGGGREVVFDKPFSFDTQVAYPLDLVLRPGDRLETHCIFRNDSPMQVTFGEQTQEEMCYNFITAWPAGALALPPGAGSGGTFAANRCVDSLSILGSCNGVLDAPADIP